MRESRKLSADTSHDLPEHYGEGEMLGYAREGKMRSKLREVILAGFNPASLDEVLRDNDMFRSNIAVGPDFSTRVNSLIDVARQEGWLTELCGVLAEARAGNQRINSAIVSVQKWLMDQRNSNELDFQFPPDVPRQQNVGVRYLALLSIMIATVTLIGVAAWVFIDKKEQTPQSISTSGNQSPVISNTKGNVQIDMSTLTATGGGVVIGRDAKDTTINIGIPPEQLAALLKLSADLSETQKKLIAELEQKFALNQQQVRAALAILGEANIPPEHLGSRLVEVAERFKDLRATASPQTGDDPKIIALKIDARKAIDAGNLAEADALLANIEAEQGRSLDRLAVNAAATRAQRGEIALTRLRYTEAAKYFADAADRLPASEPLNRAQYLAAAGGAAYRAGTFSRAESALSEALRIRERLLASDDPIFATSLNNLAQVYGTLGRYAEAEPLLKRALAIKEKALGPEHPDVAVSLNNLAALYHKQGRYAEAEPLHKHALAIREKALGSEHLDVATSLNNLALLYQEEDRYAEAEPLSERALSIHVKELGPEHPHVATALNNLAELYRAQRRYAEAEPLQHRALAINEKVLGPEHPQVAISLNNIAMLSKALGRYAEAEPLLKRALAINEKALGPEHPDVATGLGNLADLYGEQGRNAEAEPLYKRALAIREKVRGPGHPEIATSLNDLAELYRAQGRYAEAEPLFKRVLAVREKEFGPEHPDVASSLQRLAQLYRVQGRYTQAEPLNKRALAINEKSFGPEHTAVATSLNNLAVLYELQRRYAEAEGLHKRALTINEKELGPEHPRVAAGLKNLSGVYYAQHRYAEAEPLRKRALAVWEKEFGPEHPEVAISLNDLALVYHAQRRYAEAEPLYKRALAIKEKVLGVGHPDTTTVRRNLQTLLQSTALPADASRGWWDARALGGVFLWPAGLIGGTWFLLWKMKVDRVFVPMLAFLIGHALWMIVGYSTLMLAGTPDESTTLMSVDIVLVAVLVFWVLRRKSISGVVGVGIYQAAVLGSNFLEYTTGAASIGFGMHVLLRILGIGACVYALALLRGRKHKQATGGRKASGGQRGNHPESSAVQQQGAL